MNDNLYIKNENLGINTLQTTPTPAVYALGALFIGGLVIGSILGTVITKKKER